MGCGGPSGSAARPCTGVFNGSVAPPGYGLTVLTCPQDSTISYYPGMRCNKPFQPTHTQTSITFHVLYLGCTGIPLQGYAPLPRYSPPAHLLPLWHARHRGSRHPPTHLLPPPKIPTPTQGRPPSKPFVVARRGRPSVRVPDPTLCDPALSPFASHSHQQSLCNDIL